jgi:hypothetical protein
LSWSVFLMDSGMAVFFHAEKIEGVVKPTAWQIVAVLSKCLTNWGCCFKMS